MAYKNWFPGGRDDQLHMDGPEEPGLRERQKWGRPLDPGTNGDHPLTGLCACKGGAEGGC